MSTEKNKNNTRSSARNNARSRAKDSTLIVITVVNSYDYEDYSS